MFAQEVEEGALRGDGVRQIAAQAIDAAERGLESAAEDVGLRYALFLLWQVVQAARSPDWRTQIEGLGLTVEGPFEFLAAIQYAVDDYVSAHGGPTQVSETAHQAMSAALSDLLVSQNVSLFASGSEELRERLYRLSTRKGFSEFGQRFFGAFLSQYLNFYLSRITATHSGSTALPQVGDVTSFNRALRAHCQQSALIVRDFTGQWFGKAEYEGPVDEKAIGRFLWVALTKLRDELRTQAA